jgi:hypothetical protein
MMIKANRSMCVSVKCEGSKPNKMFPLLNGPSAQKRNISIKENMNLLIEIGTREFKEVNEFIKELDEAHKKSFNIPLKKENDTDTDTEFEPEVEINGEFFKNK